MLVKRDDLAQNKGRQLAVDQGGRGAIARKNAVAGLALQFRTGQALRGHQFARRIQAAPSHQRLGLGKAIGQKQTMMMGQFRLMTFGGNQELAWDHPRALMDQLVEGVLPIGAGLTPNDRAGMLGQIAAIHRHALAVAFHFKLLKIGRQAGKPLIIGQNRACRMAQDLVVPHPHKRQDHRHVLRDGCHAEMLIHRGCTLQERRKSRRSDGQDQPKPDGPPQRIAPAHPIGKAKDTIGRNAKGAGARKRGRNGHELRRRVRHASRHPCTRGFGVGHGLDGGESLGGNDYQSCFWIKPLQGVVDMRPIDVRDIMQPWPIMIRGQRQCRHRGPKIRAADADIDHIRIAPTRARDCTAPHPVSKGEKPRARGHDLGQHILAINDNRPRLRAQRTMQHRAPLGLVDGRALEHGGATALKISSARQIAQQRKRIRVEIGFRGIKHHIAQTP